MMRKYDPLRDYLSRSNEQEITLSFSEVEDILLDTLPSSARNHRAWWGNGGHTQAYAWMEAGYRVSEVDYALELVAFERTDVKPRYMEENHHRVERFIVFDVETPNRYNDRMSAIGVTIVEDEVIKEAFFSYVNPETFFDFFNTRLTGIDEDTVADAPTFPELWETLQPIFESGILVAHNAVFDLTVLRKCLQEYNIRWKDKVSYCCTVQMGKSLLPGMKHSLDMVCNYYGISLNHHQADSDSVACAKIFIRYLKSCADARNFIKEYRM